jgi:uncharacterized protein (TIGR02722 family)
MRFALLFVSTLLISCGSGTRTVQRMNVNEVKDLSGSWNDTDSRLVAEEMIRDVISRPWLSDFKMENDRKPVVIVSKVRNKTSEHLSTRTFIKDMEKFLINSGKVKFVASKKQRKRIRNERRDQQSHSSFESAKQLANETGADFMLVGSIESIIDPSIGEKVIYYQVNLELIHIETNEKVWIGDKKIKKYLQQDKFKF